jgi:ABC-type dipeptide/oligopeptide/nickel transport system permease component
VERAFGMHGLGEATLAAAAHGDVTFLLALAALAAAWAVVALTAADVAAAAADPRTVAALGKAGARRV